VETPEILNKWTVGVNVVGVIFSILAFSGSGGSFGMLIIFPIFLAFVFTFAFIHSFYLKTIKDKLIGGLIDLASILLIGLLAGMQDGADQFFLALFVVYLIPAIIIVFLSWGLTFLWEKYKK